MAGNQNSVIGMLLGKKPANGADSNVGLISIYLLYLTAIVPSSC